MGCYPKPEIRNRFYMTPCVEGQAEAQNSQEQDLQDGENLSQPRLWRHLWCRGVLIFRGLGVLGIEGSRFRGQGSGVPGLIGSKALRLGSLRSRNEKELWRGGFLMAKWASCRRPSGPFRTKGIARNGRFNRHCDGVAHHAIKILAARLKSEVQEEVAVPSECSGM